MPNILSLFTSLLKLISNGSSSDAPDANGQDGPTTQSPAQILIKIERKESSTDGVFGVLMVGSTVVCQTMENLGKEIPEGLYDAVIDASPRLGYMCPHIRVPSRDQKTPAEDAGIRIHIANAPCQLKGCIATGTEKDGDAVDNSRTAFESLMALLPPPGVLFKVLVYHIH